MRAPAFPVIAADDATARLDLLQAGLDMIDQGFTIIDSELRLVAWNRTFFTMLEFPDELARFGTPFGAFMRYNAERGEYGPGDVDTLVRFRVERARRFEAHYFERVRPNGRIIAVRGEPVPGRGFVTLYTDITEQRRSEQLIQEQNSELERRVCERTEALERTQAALLNAQKMEAVGQLAGGLAHDFNNMLTVIIGNLAALRERDAGRQTVDFVEPALLAAGRGVDLIRRLLTFARQQPLTPCPVAIDALVASLTVLLRRSLPENIALQMRSATTPLYALADPHQLESALLNLALNARDAMPDGGVLTIAAEAVNMDGHEADELELRPGRYIRIVVADSGTGMDAETLRRVFEPFYTTKAFTSGSGLGLSLAYGFAKQSGGALRLASVAGRGTEATLVLPWIEPAEQMAEEPSALPMVCAARRLVLLVEDDAQVRKVVRLQLTDLGYPVIEASDGEEALRMLDTVADIGIVVTDIVMPGAMDGRRLARHIRESRDDVAILLMSGYAQTPAAMQEASTLLTKPFGKRELAAALEACCR